MKPIKNIYEQIYDFDNIYQAYLSARKNKRYREEVLVFTANLEENIITIQNELIHEMYSVGRYREFYVLLPKKRLIMALPFKDRVVQWPIYRVIYPILSKEYIAHTYACIEGRGAHGAMKKLHYWLRLVNKKPGKWFYLKLDISKFFYRIDHDVLLNIFRRKFADERLLNLLEIIVRSEETAFGLPKGYNPDETDERLYNKGVPIGNLTSQLFANTYLNELDQYCKRKLQIQYYVRYMDDIIILCDDKSKIQEYKNLIETFLKDVLCLDLNKKTAVRPITLGIEFVGYKIWPTHIKLRKSTALKMKRQMNNLKRLYSEGKIELDSINETTASYFGLMKHCNSYSLRSQLCKDFVLVRKSKE